MYGLAKGTSTLGDYPSDGDGTAHTHYEIRSDSKDVNCLLDVVCLVK